MALRVTVAGLGPRGRQWVQAVEETPGFELAAAVDPLAAAREGVAAPVFGDLEAALRAVPSDAVVVASDPSSHYAPCRTALEHDQRLLVEKPFTTDLAEARRLVELGEQRGRPVLVAQNYRYTRTYQGVRETLPRLGPIHLITMAYYRVPHEMAPGLRKLPCSVLWGMGIHHVDAVRWALGEEFQEVLAEAFGDSLQLLMKLCSGARVSATFTYQSSGHQFFERGQEFYQRWVGERGTLHVFQRWLLLCLNDRWPRLVARPPKRMTEERRLLEMLAAGESSGRENLGTVAAMEATLRSVRERRWVPIDSGGA